MMAKKRVVATALCLVVCLMTFTAPKATAADSGVGSGSGIMPLMKYIFDAEYDFVISGGKAIMYATVSGHSSLATKCQVNVELQEESLLYWDTVKSWTATENGRRAELDVSQSVLAGETYRMVTTVTAWSGSASETKTMISETLVA